MEQLHRAKLDSYWAIRESTSGSIHVLLSDTSPRICAELDNLVKTQPYTRYSDLEYRQKVSREYDPIGDSIYNNVTCDIAAVRI